jgi:uncharacterized membrane protein YidH (DUF202 family)
MVMQSDREAAPDSQVSESGAGPAADRKAQRRAELMAELEWEREMRAKVHRHLGWVATLLVVVAIGVALSRMQAMFGVTAWEALKIGVPAFKWVLLIFGLGILFSMGTTRILMGIEWIIGKIVGRKRGPNPE